MNPQTGYQICRTEADIIRPFCNIDPNLSIKYGLTEEARNLVIDPDMLSTTVN